MWISLIMVSLIIVSNCCSSITRSTELEYVTIDGDCNFGRPSFPSRNEMIANTMISKNSMTNIKFCNVWYNSSKGILRLWLQKTSNRTKTSLVGMVLDEQGVLVLPGYVTEAEDHVAYPFHICPSLEKSGNRNYSIILSGTPPTGINLTVQVDESIMTERKVKTLQFGHKITSRLLVFDVSTIQGKFDHFQVTVRSDDDTHECLLFVSNNCEDVVNVDAIDPQAVNFKESSGTLHLTFTTFGRITLSHASKPQLTAGRWYIGVFLKNANGKNHEEFTKTVKVSVGFAGGINRVSFTQPILRLVLLSLFGGGVIALFADFFLNPEFEHRIIHKLRMYFLSHIFKVEDETDTASANAEGQNEVRSTALQTNGGHSSLPTGSICLDLGQDSQPPYDIVKLSIPKHWPGLKNWGNVMLDWFRDDERSYAYTTGIVAISLLTGAVQFIVSNWRDMIESGNRDICYYNEGCYRATSLVDVPYNLIISNLTYVIHGYIIALSISLREATCRVNERMLNVTVRKDSFSIMYAFALSLIFQGIFSACYHMCPSRMTFQFDSAFMFVICGLVIVTAFNSLVNKTQRRQSIEKETPAYVSPVFETKLYLFFVMPLLVLNYIGSLRDTEGLLLFSDVLFYFMCILWITCMFAWVFLRLMMPWKPRREPAFWCKFAWLCGLFPVVMLFIGLYTVNLQKNWSIFFLFTCLAAVMFTIIGYSLTACSQNIFKHAKQKQDVTERGAPIKWKMYLKWPIINFHVILYAICTMACWLIALYYFLQKPVTDKVKLASKSRELNAECSLWEFFDDHDLWHIASSFASMLTAYLIIWCIG